MIIDKLDNMNIYAEIPQEVEEFLCGDITPGKQVINEKLWVNVETYRTKNISDAKYEAHKNYIDIQILKSGKEAIFIKDKTTLKKGIPYNSEKDIEFFTAPVKNSDNSVILDGTNFVMLYPHEAHAPQISINEEQNEVLKIVFKVKVDNK